MENNEISIYPIPSNNIIQFSKIDNIKEIIIFDMIGNRVISTNDILSQKINVSSLELGKYVMLIHMKDGRTLSKKIIKN